MKLFVQSSLDYRFAAPSDVLLQVEAAAIPEQSVVDPVLRISDVGHRARVPGQDMIGERIWLSVEARLTVEYRATVEIGRVLAEIATLPMVPLHRLPGETVAYLMASRYCPSDQFQSFVDAESAVCKVARG